MAILRPVEPRGRRAAARGWLVAVLIVATVGTAIVKPWSWREGPATDEAAATNAPPSAVVLPTAAPSPVVAQAPYRPARLPLFRSDIFDFVRRTPAWELLVGALIGDFSLGGHSTIAPKPLAELDLQADAMRLGPADHLVALAINHPLTADVQDLRLWRFPDDGRRPYRVPLVHLPAPRWNAQLRVIGLQLREGSDELTAWPPGRYRLDLLIGGVRPEVRSLALLVDQNSDGRPERGRQPPGTVDGGGLVADVASTWWSCARPCVNERRM